MKSHIVLLNLKIENAKKQTKVKQLQNETTKICHLCKYINYC